MRFSFLLLTDTFVTPWAFKQRISYCLNCQLFIWALVEWLSIFVLLKLNSKKQVWKDIIVPDWRINISVGNSSLLCFDGESLNLARYQPDQVYSRLAFIPSFTWVLNVYWVEQLLRLKSRCLVLCLTLQRLVMDFEVWRLCYMFRCLWCLFKTRKIKKRAGAKRVRWIHSLFVICQASRLNKSIWCGVA